MKGGRTDIEGNGDASLFLGKQVAKFKKKTAIFFKSLAVFCASSGGK